MRIVISLLLVTISTAIFGQNTLTPEKLWEIKRISGGNVSPDGQYVLFSQKTYDISTNKGNSDLYIFHVKSNEIKQLTNTPFSEFEAQWTANNMIWFLSTEKDGLQIWKMDAQGQNKTQISHFIDIELEGFKVASDESALLTLQAVKMKQNVNEIYEDLPYANARIEDDLMYRHWDHWDDYKKRHLFHYSVKLGESIKLSVGKDLLQGQPYNAILPPFGGMEQITFTPDNKGAIYTSKKTEGKEFAVSTNSELYEVDFESGKTNCLTTGKMGYDTNPSYSSKGLLAWLSMARDGFESDKNNIYIRNADGKERNLTKDLDLTVSDYVWNPNGDFIYFIAATKATKQIFEITVATGELRQLTMGQHDFVSISSFGNTIYAGKQSMIHPVDLFKLTVNKAKKSKGPAIVETQITHANDELFNALEKPTVKERWVTTTDGEQMLVWMILPPNFDETKKYPTLLYCQGGPQSAVSQFFSYRWNFMLMASEGYIVVAPNRRGLPGFGQEWNDAISKDWGGQAMDDYLSAIDDAAKEPYVDEEKLGAIGASYGGYSVYYLAGIHNKRFKSFVSHCGLFNLESWYGTTEELFFANWDIGGPYWEKQNHEYYEKNSPHRFVQNWDTPILVIHGGNDFRVPISEGMQAFQAAQLQGLKSKFLYFPEEGHWVLSPQNGLVWHREFFKWLASDLK